MAKNNKIKTDAAPRDKNPANGRIGLVATILMLVISAVLMAMAFHPRDIPLFAWFGMVPLMMVIVRKGLLGAALWPLLAGYAFFFLGANWVSAVSYMGLFAMCVPLCVYFGLFGLVANLAVKRLRLPLMLVAPAVWVACEYLRAFVLTGFPWLFLAHTQYAVLPLIQISDITGAYGVSFLIVLVNAFIAEAALKLLSKQRYRKLDTRGLLPRLAFLVAAFAVVLGYGFWRLGDIRSATHEGPRLLIVQPNVEQYLKERRSSRSQLSGPIEEQTTAALKKLPQAGNRPDLIVWPETMVQPGFDYTPKEPDDFSAKNQKLLEQTRNDFGRPLLTGGTHVKAEPHEYQHWDTEAGKYVMETDPFTDWHNSAYFIGLDGKVLGRYDKIHLVPFGEFVPLKNIFPFLGDVILKSAGFVRNLDAGEKVVFFEMKDAKGKTYTFSTPICYEIGFPDLIATFVAEDGKKKADFLVNISNDGWFLESAELDQTTAIAAFRAVENRVAVVRSTNTGISAVIRPDGYFSWTGDVLRDNAGDMKSVRGELVRNVYVCDKLSIYSRVKDLFALMMLAFSAVILIASLILTCNKGV
jgi:apolipoprotein N-acyltransferase